MMFLFCLSMSVMTSEALKHVNNKIKRKFAFYFYLFYLFIYLFIFFFFFFFFFFVNTSTINIFISFNDVFITLDTNISGIHFKRATILYVLYRTINRHWFKDLIKLSWLFLIQLKNERLTEFWQAVRCQTFMIIHVNTTYQFSKHFLDKICIFLRNITKTRLHNFDPLKPHFYIVKPGFTGVYIIFLISAQKHRLWVLVRTASPRRF